MISASRRLLFGTAGVPLSTPAASTLAAIEHVKKLGLGCLEVEFVKGTIEEIPLPDLLQLLSTSKKNGVLVIRTDDDVGKIYMRKGNIYQALINDLEEVPSMKALFRMLTWQSGLFDLEPPDERPGV